MYIHILKSKDGAKQIMQFSDFKGMPFVGDPVYWEREALYAVDARKMLAAVLTQDFEACGAIEIEQVPHSE